MPGTAGSPSRRAKLALAAHRQMYLACPGIIIDMGRDLIAFYAFSVARGSCLLISGSKVRVLVRPPAYLIDIARGFPLSGKLPVDICWDEQDIDRTGGTDSWL